MFYIDNVILSRKASSFQNVVDFSDGDVIFLLDGGRDIHSDFKVFYFLLTVRLSYFKALMRSSRSIVYGDYDWPIGVIEKKDNRISFRTIFFNDEIIDDDINSAIKNCVDEYRKTYSGNIELISCMDIFIRGFEKLHGFPF